MSSSKQLRSLMKAIKASDIEEVEEVLAGIESSAVLNSREIGYDPLPVAVATGSEEIVEALLKANCDVNGTDKRHRSALVVAYTEEQLDIFILLLKRGADPNVAFEKSTLFNSTIEEDFHQFEEALLTHCRKTLDVNFTGKDQRTALMSAICTDAIENAVTLLGDPWNADPGHSSKDGEFPVHAAASLGHDRILELLGEKEASRPDGSPDKATPLMHAAQEGHVSSMETLVKLGADAKAVNTQGMTALHIVTVETKGTDAEIAGLEVLLGAGADVNAVTQKGHTPLDMCAGWEGGQAVLRAAGGEERTPFDFETDDDAAGSDDEGSSDGAASDDEASARKQANLAQLKSGKSIRRGVKKETPEAARKLSCGQWVLVTVLLVSCVLPLFLPLLEYLAGPEDLFSLMDKDNDARVSQDEFEAGYLLLTKKKEMDAAGLSQFFQQDSDRDGFISWSEFMLPKGADPTPESQKSLPKPQAKTTKTATKKKKKTKTKTKNKE